MCFGEAEAAALQVPAAIMTARAAAAAAAEQHGGALPLLRALGLGANWRSRAAWLWAASTLSSRTMFLPFDSAGALMPLGDYANYRPPPPPVVPRLPDLVAAAAALQSAAGTAAAAGEAAAGAPAASPRAAVAAELAEQLAASRLDPGAEAGQCIAGDGSLDKGAGEYRLYARVG